MNEKKVLLTGIILAISSLIVTMTVLHFFHVKQEALYQSQLNRYSSYLLADQLRQSSDDLTRMARTYVITHDDKYRQMYTDILAIRNGEKPRPLHMERVYWDLVLKYGDKPRADGPQIPLRELMKKAGFSQQEFLMLDRAQKNSDTLVDTEMVAMNAVNGVFRDGEGNFVVKAAPDFNLALRIMHDARYHEDKFSIMKPIDEFLQSLDERTAGEVTARKTEVLMYEEMLVLCIIMTFIVLIVGTFMIYKGISLIKSPPAIIDEDF